MLNVENNQQSSNRENGRSPPIEAVLDAVRETILDALDAHEAPRCLSVDEAAERLGVSRRTLASLVHGGEIRSIKVKRRRLIPVEALEQYVERKLDGGPPPG